MPRNALSLKNKLELIECFEREKLSVKQLQKRFNCGKTQVYEAIKKKEDIKKVVEKGLSLRSKRRTPSCENEELNKLVWEWFVQARSRNIPLSGPIVQEKAKEFAVALGKSHFKASNGWLESFKSRHNIVWNKVSVESYDVNMTIVEEWQGMIQRRIKDYQPCDIYSGDETGIFFRALPFKTCLTGENCKVGKESKERLTLYVCGNMSGELVTPMVIGKSAQPGCFKNPDIRKLPVIWKSNKKAWNTVSIMKEWLESFNSDMKRKGRKVILFLDNATCHPKLCLTNVELAWLPGNMSGVIQPMEQGVISSLKALYRKHLMQYLLSTVDAENTVSDTLKKISVLDAINWIHQAVKEIKPTTVTSSFAKAGFILEEDSEIGKKQMSFFLAVAIFVPIYECININITFSESTQGLTQLQDLIGSNADAEEFVNFDNYLPISNENEILVNSTESGSESESDEEVKSSSNGYKSIKSYKEILIKLRDLVDSSLHKGNSDLVNILNEAVGNVENCIIQENKEKQSKITE